jgi:hypothetical protein
VGNVDLEGLIQAWGDRWARPEPSDAGREAALSAPLGIGLGAFLAQTFPPLEAFVEGILYGDGCGWIGGEEKLGKSYYAVEEAICLALGLPVCGRFAVPQRRRVVFLEEEDPPRRLHARIRALLRGKDLDPDDPALRVDLDAWFRLAVWEGFSFDSPALVARLEATCEDFKPAVVYGDVLRKLTLKDLNKGPEAGALLAELDRLRRTHGVIFRVVHHYRKSQGFRTGRGSQEIGGSFQLGAWAEASLFFEPIGRKQGAVKVDVQTKDAPPHPGFSLTIESEGPLHDPTWVRLKAEDLAQGNRAADEANDERVLEALAVLAPVPAREGRPGVTLEAIFTAAKMSERTTRRSLTRLEDAGRCVVTGYLAKRKKLYGLSSNEPRDLQPGQPKFGQP